MTNIDLLFNAARLVQANAYAPYSNFKVGAAILGKNGVIYRGCNVENAAYPVGACAEMGALSAMIADGETRFQAIVILGSSGKTTTPCGACRQRLREFAEPSSTIHCGHTQAIDAVYSIGELLPDAFGPENISSTSSI